MKLLLRTRRGGWLTGAAVAAVTVTAVGVSAWAYWTSIAEGSGPVSGTTLEAPTPTMAAGPEAVNLSWTPVTPPAPGTVTYYVRRDGGTPAGNGPTSAAPTSVTSCTDGEGTVTVKAGTAKTFTVPTPSEQEAGVAFNLMLTATDEWGNTAKSYTGSKALTWSGPANSPNATAPEYPTSATTVTFAEGVGTASSIKLVDAQSTTLKATEGTVTGTSGSFTVKAATAERFGWANAAVTAGSIEAGTCPFACKTTSIGASKKFTAHASITDKYGNIVSNLGSTNTAKVEKTGGEGTLTKATGLTIPTSGLAESSATFEYTSPASGTSEAILKLRAEAGTAYTEAEAHVKY